MPAPLHEQAYHTVPLLAAADAHAHLVGALMDNLHAQDGRTNHRAGEVASEQQIAAATDNKKRLAETASHCACLLDRSIFDKPLATGINAKGVVRFQTVIFENFHQVISFVSFQ